MTEKLKSSILVPVWVITLVVSVLLTASSFVVNLSVKAGQSRQIIDDTKIKIENKVDRAQYDRDVDRIYKTLDRIEGKIDQIKR
jgi:hypothetical protein